MIFETMAFDNEGRTPHDATLVRVLPCDAFYYSLSCLRRRNQPKTTHPCELRVQLWFRTPRRPLSIAQTVTRFLLAPNKAHISGPRPPWMPYRHLLYLRKTIVTPLLHLSLTLRWIPNTTVPLCIVNILQDSVSTATQPLVPLGNLSLGYSMPLLSHTSLALVVLHFPLL